MPPLHCAAVVDQYLLPGRDRGRRGGFYAMPTGAAGRKGEAKDCGKDGGSNWSVGQSVSRYRTTGIVPSAPRVWVVRSPSGAIPFFS